MKKENQQLRREVTRLRNKYETYIIRENQRLRQENQRLRNQGTTTKRDDTYEAVATVVRTAKKLFAL